MIGQHQRFKTIFIKRVTADILKERKKTPLHTILLGFVFKGAGRSFYLYRTSGNHMPMAGNM
jgi:hypothetical protein